MKHNLKTEMSEVGIQIRASRGDVIPDRSAIRISKGGGEPPRDLMAVLQMSKTG